MSGSPGRLMRLPFNDRSSRFFFFGAIFGKEGDSLKALYCLHRSLRDRDYGPADRVRSRLRLHGVGRHRASEGAFYTGAGDRGTGGLGLPREPRSAGAAGESYFSALEPLNMRLCSILSLKEICEIDSGEPR